MPYTVKDFHGLLNLLESRPEWRAELRRFVLSEELLNLPKVIAELSENVRDLAKAQKRTEDRLDALAEAQKRTEERLDALAEAQKRTEERLDALASHVSQLTFRMDQLAEALLRTEQRIEELSDIQKRMIIDVGILKGRDLERLYRERAASFFQSVLRRIKVIDHQDLGHILDDAVDGGSITLKEKEEVLRADVVVQGQRDGQKVYLLVEVSVVVDLNDVRRAAQRAVILQKATEFPTLASVAGQHIIEDAQLQAMKSGVWCVIDGVINASIE